MRTSPDKIRMQKTSPPSNLAKPQNRESPTGGYWFTDLKQAYSFPSFKKLTGKGVTIGILMEGNFNQPDMDDLFRARVAGHAENLHRQDRGRCSVRSQRFI